MDRFSSAPRPVVVLQVGDLSPFGLENILVRNRALERNAIRDRACDQ